MHALDRASHDDLLRPLLQTSWRFYLLVAFLGAHRRCRRSSRGSSQMYMRLRHHRHQLAGLLGLLRHQLRVLDRHQPRRHADLRDPAPRQCRLAPAGHALRRSHHRVRADDRRDVPDHPPRPAVAGVLAVPVSERAADLAELPVAAGVGLLRDQHLSHRQPAVPLPADDSRLRRRARPVHRAAQQDLRRRSRSAGAARRSSGTGSRSAMQIMAIAIIPVAVSVHTIVSFDFSMAPVPMWHSTIFGPYFVAGAIFSGIAGLIIAMAILRQVPAPRGVPAPGPLREPRQAAAGDGAAVGLLRVQRAAGHLLRQRPVRDGGVLAHAARIVRAALLDDGRLQLRAAARRSWASGGSGRSPAASSPRSASSSACGSSAS